MEEKREEKGKNKGEFLERISKKEGGGVMFYEFGDFFGNVKEVFGKVFLECGLKNKREFNFVFFVSVIQSEWVNILLNLLKSVCLDKMDDKNDLFAGETSDFVVKFGGNNINVWVVGVKDNPMLNDTSIDVNFEGARGIGTVVFVSCFLNMDNFEKVSNWAFVNNILVKKVFVLTFFEEMRDYFIEKEWNFIVDRVPDFIICEKSSANQVCEWIEEKFPNIGEKFLSNRIDGKMLKFVTYNTLSDMGVDSIEVKLRILCEIHDAFHEIP